MHSSLDEHLYEINYNSLPRNKMYVTRLKKFSLQKKITYVCGQRAVNSFGIKFYFQT
jgi:hypothetical protein